MNRYTIWISVDSGIPVPVHYEMKGYNSLLGSHYDHYFLSYTDYSTEKPADQVFDLFLEKSCHGFPGPGLAKDHVYTMNPAREFVNNHETHVR